jgi:hypothetical protein
MVQLGFSPDCLAVCLVLLAPSCFYKDAGNLCTACCASLCEVSL